MTQCTSRLHFPSFKKIQTQALPSLENKPSTQLIDAMSFRNGAHVGGPKYYAVNLIFWLFLYHFLHTMSLWHHESIHNNTNNQQTPPPWWRSRLPLQRRGFNESTPPEWRVALLMFVPRPLSKGFGRINKLKQLLINFYQPLMFSNLACRPATMVAKMASIIIGGCPKHSNRLITL